MGPLNSALFKAIEEGNETTAKLLLNAGADKDKVNELGYTPLYIAAFYGHNQIVKLLLDLGADPNKINEYGRAPLYIVARESHIEIMKLLTRRTKAIVPIWKKPPVKGHLLLPPECALGS